MSLWFRMALSAKRARTIPSKRPKPSPIPMIAHPASDWGGSKLVESHNPNVAARIVATTALQRMILVRVEIIKVFANHVTMAWSQTTLNASTNAQSIQFSFMAIGLGANIIHSTQGHFDFPRLPCGARARSGSKPYFRRQRRPRDYQFWLPGYRNRLVISWCSRPHPPPMPWW
jgi:hypothetical protein